MSIWTHQERILAAALRAATTREGRNRVQDLRFAQHYREPGYGDSPARMIVFGNWNEVSRWDEATHRYVPLDRIMPRLARLFERFGASLEWSDEWDTCPECGYAFRTEPDSYGWQPAYVQQEDAYRCCRECVDGASFLESIEGDHERAVSRTVVNPGDHHYRRVDRTFENGFYPGQAASPEQIAEALREQEIERFVFTIDSTGQFDVRFSVWIHEDEYERFSIEDFDGHGTDGPEPAAAMKRALDSLKLPSPSSAPPGTIQVATISLGRDGDAAVDVRTISRQEWVEHGTRGGAR